MFLVQVLQSVSGGSHDIARCPGDISHLALGCRGDCNSNPHRNGNHWTRHDESHNAPNCRGTTDLTLGKRLLGLGLFRLSRTCSGRRSRCSVCWNAIVGHGVGFLEGISKRLFGNDMFHLGRTCSRSRCLHRVVCWNAIVGHGVGFLEGILVFNGVGHGYLFLKLVLK